VRRSDREAEEGEREGDLLIPRRGSGGGRPLVGPFAAIAANSSEELSQGVEELDGQLAGLGETQGREERAGARRAHLGGRHGADDGLVEHIGLFLTGHVHPHEGRLHVGERDPEG
jgi:hypothetical protein